MADSKRRSRKDENDSNAGTGLAEPRNLAEATPDQHAPEEAHPTGGKGMSKEDRAEALKVNADENTRQAAEGDGDNPGDGVREGEGGSDYARRDEVPVDGTPAADVPVSVGQNGARRVQGQEWDFTPPNSKINATVRPDRDGMGPMLSQSTSPESAPLEPLPQVDGEEPTLPPSITDNGVELAAKSNELYVAGEDGEDETPGGDDLFEPLHEHGTAMVLKRRLMEHAYVGLHNNRIDRLVLPAGSVVTQMQADQIKARLEWQGEFARRKAKQDAKKGE